MNNENASDVLWSFIAGMVVALLMTWFIRNRMRRHARTAPEQAGEVMGVSTPGNPSGLAPPQTHVAPTGI